MKIQFNFADRKEINNTNYEIGFTIVGVTNVDKTELVIALQTPHGLEKIRQKITTELVALLQLDLYEKVIESGGDNEKKTVYAQRIDVPVVTESSTAATEIETAHS